MARRVASLRSSRDRVSRERDLPEREDRLVRELGVRLFTMWNLPQAARIGWRDRL